MEETVRDRIKKLCNSKGLTFHSLEKILGLGNGTISKYDKYTPSGNNLYKIANYFNVPEGYILYGDDYEIHYFNQDNSETHSTENGRESIQAQINKIISSMTTEEMKSLLQFLDHHTRSN